MSFETLGLHRWVAKQCEYMAMKSPTEVQTACIPAILKGKHVVGGAVTGSGKTAAFALPVLQMLSDEMYGVFALVLTPSRELAYQIVDQFVGLGAPVGVRTAIVIGGASHGDQMGTLTDRPHVVVATPGRLRMILTNFPEVCDAMRNLRFLILDEADRLLDGDLKDDVLACVDLLGKPKPFRRTLLFSATTDDRITKVDAGTLPLLGVNSQDSLAVCCCTPEGVSGNTQYTIAPALSQHYLRPGSMKLPYTVCLLRTFPKDSSTIIFCNSCFRSEVLRLSLQRLGIPVCSLNSLLTQQKRLMNLALFKAGVTKVLVATDIAARGLDIPDVEQVVHYDFPKLSTTYVHRVGRTARAGRSGTSIAMISPTEMPKMHMFERHTKSKISLLRDSKVTDVAVANILDEVSIAKVEAQLEIEEKFGERATALKQVGQQRRQETKKLIRRDGRNKNVNEENESNHSERIGKGKRSLSSTGNVKKKVRVEMPKKESEKIFKPKSNTNS